MKFMALGTKRTPTTVSVSDLAKDMNTIVKSKIKYVDAYGYAADQLLPERFMVTAVTKPNINYKVMQVSGIDIEKKKRVNLYLPEKLEFDTISGKEKDTLMKEFKATRLELLAQLIQPLSVLSGSDPEVFIENKDGDIVPAFKFLEAKDSPNNKLKRSGHSFPLAYWDGFQAEFELPACGCLEEFCAYIHGALLHIQTEARKIDPSARLTVKPVIRVPEETLKTTEAKFLEFGCKPTFNAYGLQGNLSNPQEQIFRSAGFHMHFGYSKQNLKVNPDVLVKALDATVGLLTVSLFASVDTPVRRQFYGLAGEYRLPNHGLEYRTLSSAMLCHPVLVHMVYDFARAVMNFANTPSLADLLDIKESDVVETIQNCDFVKARKLIEKHKTVFKGILKSAPNYGGYSDSTLDLWLESFLNGVESIIETPDNIERNWILDDVDTVGFSSGNQTRVTTFRYARPLLEKKKKL